MSLTTPSWQQMLIWTISVLCQWQTRPWQTPKRLPCGARDNLTDCNYLSAMSLMETGPITYLRYNILLPSNLSIIAERILGRYCCQWRRWRPRRAPNRWNYTIQRQRGEQRGEASRIALHRTVPRSRQATLLSDRRATYPCSSLWAIIGIFDCSGRQVKRVSVDEW